ncbi:uncharacterized protein LOC144450841 [Glandiceps talaboti]
MSSANPATPLTRSQYRDSCTSVLMGIDSIYRHGIILNEPLDEELKQLAKMLDTIRPEVDDNLEYYVDGPLVRFLTTKITKLKAIVCEIRRACSQRNVNLHGQNHLDRHLDEHLQQLKEVKQELEPFYQNTVERRANMEEAMRQHHLDALAKSKWAPGASQQTTTGGAMKTPGSSDRNVRFEGGVIDPAMAQMEENTAAESTGLYERPVQSKEPRSDTWPEDEPFPPYPEMRTQPPFVDGRLRDLNAYKDLPQFTGKDLPVPKLPDAELGYIAPHTKHWDHHDTVMY